MQFNLFLCFCCCCASHFCDDCCCGCGKMQLHFSSYSHLFVGQVLTHADGCRAVNELAALLPPIGDRICCVAPFRKRYWIRSTKQRVIAHLCDADDRVPVAHTHHHMPFPLFHCFLVLFFTFLFCVLCCFSLLACLLACLGEARRGSVGRITVVLLVRNR